MQAIITPTPDLILPSLGAYSADLGGLRIGEMLSENESPNWNIILPTGEHKKDFGRRKWGKVSELIVGADHVRDGYANTVAMAEANNDLAQEILESGLYLASQAEAYYCFVVAREQFDKDWAYWTSTQCSSGNAWIQDFENGYQGNGGKDYERPALVVRRSIIQ